MITMQEAARMATTDPKLGEFMVTAAAALRSTNPEESFRWLASVEQDPDLKFGFEKAAELLHARRETDTS